MKNETLDRVEELKYLYNEYEAKIKDKQDLLRNLENRVNDATQRLEATKRHENQELMIERSKLQAEYQQKENDLKSKELAFEVKMAELTNRDRELQVLEEDYGKREKEIKNLNLERRDIFLQRAELEKDIEKNQVILAETEGLLKEVERRERGFTNREETVKRDEERIKIQKGMLETAKQEFELEKNRILAIQKTWEVKDGKLGTITESKAGSGETSKPEGSVRQRDGISEKSFEGRKE